jgi:predicted enzyme related to lactoylglutathione lyase
MSQRARFVGINHVALEVGDIDRALEFYGRIFAFELRGRIGRKMAFLDAGDQFIALSAPRRQGSDDSRHLGLVVDDPEAVREALESEGSSASPAAASTSSIPGATGSRSSGTTRSSSPRPRRRSAVSASTGSARRRRPRRSCGRRDWSIEGLPSGRRDSPLSWCSPRRRHEPRSPAGDLIGGPGGRRLPDSDNRGQFMPRMARNATRATNGGHYPSRPWRSSRAAEVVPRRRLKRTPALPRARCAVRR